MFNKTKPLDRENAIALFTRLQNRALQPGDLIDLADVTFDGDETWVDGMMAGTDLHDPDYVIFQYFTDPATRILDVGANRGYSVSSMRAAGCLSQIMSFEVSEAFRTSLARVKEIEAGRHDYVICGVGDESGTAEFFIPTVNGLCLSALTTANTDMLVPEGVVSNIELYVDNYMPATHKRKVTDVKICRMVSKIDRLDSLVPPGDDIVAIKLDVEGLEYQALRGGENLLKATYPLLVAEGANYHEALIAYLQGIGYVRAQRQENTLILPDAAPTELNAFFVHESHIASYQKVGLVSA